MALFPQGWVMPKPLVWTFITVFVLAVLVSLFLGYRWWQTEKHRPHLVLDAYGNVLNADGSIAFRPY